MQRGTPTNLFGVPPTVGRGLRQQVDAPGRTTCEHDTPVAWCRGVVLGAGGSYVWCRRRNLLLVARD